MALYYGLKLRAKYVKYQIYKERWGEERWGVCICILTGLRFLLLFLVFHEKLLIKSYKNHQNSNF